MPSTNLAKYSERKIQSFTLIEALVSMAILVLIFLLISQIFVNSAQVIRDARSRISAGQTAQTFFDVLGSDISLMTTRHNARVILSGSPALYSPQSDAIAFVTAARSVISANPLQNRLSAVYYGIVLQDFPAMGPNAINLPTMTRGVNRVVWSDGADGISAAPAAITPLASSGGTGIDAFERLSEGVFRMEFVYILQDGSISPVPPMLSSGDFIPPPLSGLIALDSKRLKGIIVTIAVLDNRALRILLDSNAISIQELAQSLPKVTLAGQTATQLWSNTALPSNLPRPVRANIRFYERTYLFPRDSRT